MLSHTSEYALQAVLYIARRGGGDAVKLEPMAGALKLPRNYLSKTLHALVGEGVLTSERGPAGGFRLARAPEAVTLADIVEPFEPTRLARRCILGKGMCSDATACAAHERWKRIAEPMRGFFRETTVADLVDEERAIELAADVQRAS